MKITEIHVSFGRTFIPAGGDRYQPLRIDCGVIVRLNDEDEPSAARIEAQAQVRAMVEETYEAQVLVPQRERAARGQSGG